MRIPRVFSVVVCSFALAGPVMGQSDAAMPEMHHHHDDDAPAAGEKLGTVSFPTSCAAVSQKGMERGVALLHSFSYTLAQMQFESLAKSDPACAMAYWGSAMTQFQELWGYPDKKQLARGTKEMAEARKLANKGTTPREYAYIDALGTFFDPKKMRIQQRLDAYTAKMNALHAAFPGDVEGAAFDALAILASTPPGDISLTHEHKALAILVPLFAAHPDHPGLAHYIIHTCDTPALAQDGLSAAREYAKIAPSSPHALHMPGHIFARLGMWQEDIDSNVASVKASEKAEAAGVPGAAHQMHADEFLVYAYLQVGEQGKAHALVQKIPELGARMAAMPGMDDMKDEGHFLSNELSAIYALETHDWKLAAALTPEVGSSAYEGFDTCWAQGIAAGHLHDPKLAAEALAGFDKSIEVLKRSAFGSYSRSMTIKRDELLGWQAYAEDRPEDAVLAMRRAADLQDKMGQGEVDLPTREMLGDLLVMEHKPADALAEYRVALKLSPNRLNGLLGAGRAAEMAGMPDVARTYYKTAVDQVSAQADNRSPEMLHAVEVVRAVSVARNGA